MPKKPPIDIDDEEFDLDDVIEMEDDDGEEEAFEVDGDVIERIAKALETIAKVLVDREAKFASRPPRDGKSFGDRPQRSFGGDRGGDRDGGKFENKREFVRPGYGEKTFRNGPGVGFSDREKPARSSAPRAGGAGAGKPYGKPAGGRGAPPKGGPKPRGKY